MGVIRDMIRAVGSLSDNLNKAKTVEIDETEEGAVGDQIESLMEVEKKDDDLLLLAKNWKARWDEYTNGESNLREIYTVSEKLWKGSQSDNNAYKKERLDNRPINYNVIFESVETYLPIVTREAAEPTVSGGNTPEGIKIAEDIRKTLIYITDHRKLRLKVRKAERFRQLYRLGCIKVMWDAEENEVIYYNIRPQRLILDPNAEIIDGEYTGEYIGEIKKKRAENMVKIFPKFKKQIESLVKDKMGTIVQYVEWWTDELKFSTLENVGILEKYKNPHFNYNETHKIEGVDEEGNPTQEDHILEGKNHFSAPKKPYCFLTVFDLGKHPHDETSLIEQASSLQDAVNKRLKQIDQNADNANNGIIINGDVFTKEEAEQVRDQLRKGSVVWVPSGDNIDGAVKFPQWNALTSDIFNNLIYCEKAIRSLFGVAGSSAQALQGEKTVRGKMVATQKDSDRNALPTDALEGLYSIIYDYTIQMMYVYYYKDHLVSIIGKDKTEEFIKLTKDKIQASKLVVGVKEGSLIPTDALSKRNEAMDLWAEKAIHPKEFYSRLDFPDPVQQAKLLWQYTNDPVGYLMGIPPEVSMKKVLGLSNPQPILPENGGSPTTLPNPNESGEAGPAENTDVLPPVPAEEQAPSINIANLPQ